MCVATRRDAGNGKVESGAGGGSDEDGSTPVGIEALKTAA
jgi:hypothetical protein